MSIAHGLSNLGQLHLSPLASMNALSHSRVSEEASRRARETASPPVAEPLVSVEDAVRAASKEGLNGIAAVYRVSQLSGVDVLTAVDRVFLTDARETAPPMAPEQRRVRLVHEDAAAAHARLRASVFDANGKFRRNGGSR